MVLRDSGSSRCDCLAIVEETEPGVVDRKCIPHPCRDGSDSEAVCRRTHKSRTLLVMETMEDPEESDSHECSHVHPNWSTCWLAMEMERASRSSWIQYSN